MSFFVGSSLSVDKWLSEVDGQTFEDWQKRSIRVVTKRPEWKKVEARGVFLQEKYFKKWHEKTLRRQATLSLDMTSNSSWLKRVLFNPSSRMAREVACQMVESFCSKDFQRKKLIIEMLTTYLGEMSQAGEAAQEFVHLYQRLITPDQVSFSTKIFLATPVLSKPYLCKG